MDAARYTFPSGNLLILLANPFVGEVMSSVLRNIKEAAAAEARTIVIIYFHPVCRDMLLACDWLHETKSSDWYCIFRVRISLNPSAAIAHL